MAKLGSYYGLCPLIDQKNLLGVSEDVEAGHVIVTLGKNIAIKYRISDQKQIHSWRTKDKFSSQVVYDKDTNQYVAVFNHVFIRMWEGGEEYVDKLKKYKFNKPIHTLVTCNQKCFIVFKNGNVSALNTGIANRKGIIPDNVSNMNTDIFVVLTAYSNDKYFVAITFHKNNKVFVSVNVFIETEVKCKTVELTRENGITLKGQILCQINNREEIVLLTLWSDGKFFFYNVDGHDSVPKANFFAPFEFLSCKDNITMAHINQHHIAMYGADSSEEGAALILYNTQFKVSQSKQLLKLFTSGAKLWKIDTNLLFCSGQSLGVMPFYLDKEQLSSLVGSHRVALIDLDPDVVLVEELQEVIWSTNNSDNVDRLIPGDIANQVLELSQQGLCESTICEMLIPQFIENKKVRGMLSCLDYFCDIPELYLILLLSFALKADSKHFHGKMLKSKSVPASLREEERCNLINKVLMFAFSDSLLLPHVHNKLDLSSTILLLQYIFYLITDSNNACGKSVTEFQNKLIDWCCILLDANYQKFLLSKDSQIVDLLSNFSSLVERYTNTLENLKQSIPLLHELKKGKKTKSKQVSNLQYSIEKLNLY